MISYSRLFKKILVMIPVLGAFLFVGVSHVYAAAITSTQSGNWSDGSTWVGGVAPGDGDSAIIATGHTVTITSDVTVGSNNSNVGHGIRINATDASTYGKLIVNAGVTLTLKGNDRSSNTMMLINRYAVFEPAPGSTIVGDAASEGQSLIDNRGIITSIGTADDHITFTNAESNRNWNNDASFSLSANITHYNGSVYVYKFNHIWISNAAGDGPGSFGDSSVVFSGTIAPSGILATEVATLSAVDAAGEYYIDYDAGMVYWYANNIATSFTVDYKYLSFYSWTINTVQNTTYNEGVFEYSDFLYMGNGNGDGDWVLYFQNRQTSAVGVRRNAKVENCTFQYAKKPIGLRSNTGTSLDPIVINNNTFRSFPHNADNYSSGMIFIFWANNSYVSIQNNYIHGRGNFLGVTAFGSIATQTGFVIRGNVAKSTGFIDSYSHSAVWPGSIIEKNFIIGYSGATDARSISGFGGTVSSPVSINDNVLMRAHRAINYSSYLDIENNYIGDFYHHGINGPASSGDLVLSDVSITGNIFANGEAGADIELGYNHRQWTDDVEISNNTLYSHAHSGGISFGDNTDAAGAQMISKANVHSNIVTDSVYGIMRPSIVADNLARMHITRTDYNNLYNNTNNYLNLNRVATFLRGDTEYNADGTRNVLGVTLFNPTYSTAQAGRSLVLDYSDSEDVTLSWGGGTPVQLVAHTGTATGATNNETNGVSGLNDNGTLVDSGQSFPTAKNNSATPIGMWVKITGGTGSGQVRRVTNTTATTLTIVPGWTTVPSTDSTYVVYVAEATLYDSGASDYVYAGIDIRDLPTSSATDDDIEMVLNGLTVDPDYVDPTRSLAGWDTSLGGAGTEDAAMTRLLADRDLIYSSLLPYLRGGFLPQNVLLNAAGYAGSDMGAVAITDSDAPEVVITDPAGSTTVTSSPLSISASSTDAFGVSGVSFYYDNTLIGSEVTATSSDDIYTTSWDISAVSNGTYSVVAVARDAEGNRATSTSVSVTINIASPSADSGGGGGGGSSGSSSGRSAGGVVQNNQISFAGGQASSTVHSKPPLLRALGRGSIGSDVETLQTFLVAKGYMTPDNITGYFGPITELAVQNFQKAEGIVSSGDAFSTGYGNVGPNTRFRINAMLGPVSSNNILPNNKLIEEQIRALQEQLKFLLFKLQNTLQP